MKVGDLITRKWPPTEDAQGLRMGLLLEQVTGWIPNSDDLYWVVQWNNHYGKLEMVAEVDLKVISKNQ
jgi:hypothetical protein